MGSRGPVAKIHQLPGVDPSVTRGGRKPKRPPKATPGVPTSPKDLDARGLAEWKRVTAELDTMGLLAKIDAAALVAYAYHWSIDVDLRAECREAQAQGDWLIAGVRGSTVANPIFAMQRSNGDRLMALCRDLLMTPVSRLRAAMPEPKDDDDAGAGVLD